MYFYLGNSGKLEWKRNWISFIDTMLQFSILGLKTKELYLPTRMQKVIIDPVKHLQYIKSLPEDSCMFFNLTYSKLRCDNMNKYLFKLSL